MRGVMDRGLAQAVVEQLPPQCAPSRFFLKMRDFGETLKVYKFCSIFANVRESGLLVPSGNNHKGNYRPLFPAVFVDTDLTPVKAKMSHF